MTDSGERVRWVDVVLCGWVWTALAAIAATLPLRNWDYWFHLTVGRLLATHRALPDSNLFGYSGPADTPVMIHAWIGEFWLYELHDLGGLVATLATRNLCALAAWACVVWCTYRLTDRHGVATAGLTAAGGLAFFAIAGFVGPHIFVFVPFGLLAVLCVASLDWERRLWMLPLVAAIVAGFWVNTASHFWVPAVMLASFALASHLKGERRRRNHFLAAMLTAIAALFVHPLGPSVFKVVLNGAGAEAWLALAGPIALAPVVRGLARWEREFRSAWGRRLALGTLALAAVLAIAAQPWSDAHRAIPAFVFGDAVRQQPPLQGYGPSNTPVEAVEVLRSWGSQPRVYAAPHLSGYILYELQSPHNPQRIVWPVPDWRPSPEVAKTKSAMESDREVFRGIAQQYGIRAVIVTPELGPVAGFVSAAPDWVEVGTWESGSLYVHERDRRVR